MAISGTRYLVVETAFFGDGGWARDLAAKPNCYLSEDLAAARADELALRALASGQVRTFEIHRSDGGAAQLPSGSPGKRSPKRWTRSGTVEGSMSSA